MGPSSVLFHRKYVCKTCTLNWILLYERACTCQEIWGKHNLMFCCYRSEEYDIYHDSNLREIIQVLPILRSFKSRLQQLLEDWPEHPTLVQVSLRGWLSWQVCFQNRSIYIIRAEAMSTKVKYYGDVQFQLAERNAGERQQRERAKIMFMFCSSYVKPSSELNLSQ